MVPIAGEGGGTRPITTGDEAALHARTRGAIEAAMAAPYNSYPVMAAATHHTPHSLCMPATHRAT